MRSTIRPTVAPQHSQHRSPRGSRCCRNRTNTADLVDNIDRQPLRRGGTVNCVTFPVPRTTPVFGLIILKILSSVDSRLVLLCAAVLAFLPFCQRTLLYAAYARAGGRSSAVRMAGAD